MGAVMDRFRLDGKVAIVTGVGPTNSRHFALAMAEAGAAVCLAARSVTHTEKIAAEVREMGGRALVCTADITDRKQVEAMVAHAKAEFGRIDILFNHVGGGAPPTGPKKILETSDEDWRNVFASNLDSMFFCTRAVAKIMIEQDSGGSIINTSSTASRTTPPMLTPYSVAKAAVNQFTRCMAVELAPHNIRVNAILLGTYENSGSKLNQIAPGFGDWWLRETPMHRFGRAGESAAAGLYLASDASAFVTGVILPVAGGIALFG
jgi:7-alpha-hydroxysteroid dehydrogenase